jgi:Chaperone of endosialidase
MYYFRFIKKLNLPQRISILLAVLMCVSFLKASAINTPYAPSQTLDPQCAPGEANCFVNFNFLGNRSGILPAPANVSATLVYDTTVGYANTGIGHNYRVYAYKNVGGGRVYSASYATLPTDITDDAAASTLYTVNLSWAAVSGADGYRIVKISNAATSSGYGGSYFDVGYDTTGTTLVDDNDVNTVFSVDASDLNSNNAIGANIHGDTSIDGALIVSGVPIHGYNSSTFAVGYNAGVNVGALPAHHSNFIGVQAGAGSDNASYSSFIGYRAGMGAINAHNSIFIGKDAGFQDAVNNTDNQDSFAINTGAPKKSLHIGNSLYILVDSNMLQILDLSNLGSTYITLNNSDGTGDMVQIGTKLYISNNSSANHSVYVVDTLTQSISNTILATVSKPKDMLLVGTKLYVLNSDPGNLTNLLSVIDTTNDSVTSLGSGFGRSMNLVGTKLYINSNAGSSGFFKILDTNTDSFLPDGNLVYATHNFIVNVGTKLYVSNDDSTISVFDTATGSISNTINMVGADLKYATYNSGKLYVSAIVGGVGKVITLDTITDTQISSVDLGSSNPFYSVLSGDYLYILHESWYAVSVLNVNTNIVQSVTVLAGSVSASLSGSDLYVLGNAPNKLAVLNISTNKIKPFHSGVFGSSILLGSYTGTGGFSNSIAFGDHAVNTAANQLMIGSSTSPIEQIVINGVSPYLNFGEPSGDAGFGFRVQGGILQVKGSNGGTWANLGAGVSLDSNNSLIVGGNVTGVLYSNIFGNNAGNTATSANNSNFLGNSAGAYSTNAAYSNFLGNSAGANATNADHSNFFGKNAGDSATNASYSNFLGAESGLNATGASFSNFLGFQAGNGASSALYSNFLGFQSGSGATSANSSNFSGRNAGQNATSANYSNFFGAYAGNGATAAFESNFIGREAGLSATTADHSNFFGTGAGHDATNASFSNLFGFQAGMSFSGNNIGSNNIIIGTNISLGNAVANSMNIGGVLFGTGFYNGYLGGSPSITPISGGKIGIGVASPSNIFHVTGAPASGTPTARIENTLGGTSLNNGLLVLAGNNTGVNASQMITFQRPDATVIGSISQNAATTVAYNTTSDARLKEGFDLNNPTTSKGLQDLLKIKVVDFDFISDSNHALTQGFIAQQLHTIYPYAVTTNGDDGVTPLADGATPWMVDYGRLTPLIVRSVQDMDIKISGVATLDITNPLSVGSLIRTFLSDVNNQIGDVYAKVVHSDRVETKELCASDGTCLSETEFKTLIQEFKDTHQAPSTPASIPAPDPVPDNGSQAQGPDAAPVVVPDSTPVVAPAPDTSSGL